MNVGKVKKIMDDMPNTILSIVVVLIILAAGVSAFFFVYRGVGYTKEQEETFPVSDPSVNNRVTLEYSPTSIVLIEQYNGFSWNTIPSSGYDVFGKEVEIDKNYLEG